VVGKYGGRESSLETDKDGSDPGQEIENKTAEELEEQEQLELAEQIELEQEYEKRLEDLGIDQEVMDSIEAERLTNPELNEAIEQAQVVLQEQEQLQGIEQAAALEEANLAELKEQVAVLEQDELVAIGNKIDQAEELVVAEMPTLAESIETEQAIDVEVEQESAFDREDYLAEAVALGEDEDIRNFQPDYVPPQEDMLNLADPMARRRAGIT